MGLPDKDCASGHMSSEFGRVYDARSKVSRIHDFGRRRAEHGQKQNTDSTDGTDYRGSSLWAEHYIDSLESDRWIAPRGAE